MPDVTGACRLLCKLLLEVPEYRKLWHREVERSRGPGLSQAGVSRVIARYLVDSGIVPENEEISLSRKTRHKVRRAISGEEMTATTLEWFVAAFDIAGDDAKNLWAAYFHGRGEPETGVTHTVLRPRPMVRPQRHRTMALFERYEIDPDGVVAFRDTTQMILAIEDDVQSYLYNHESTVERIEVLAGGELGPHHRYADGLHGHEIFLDHPLRRMQRTTLEYRTHYRRPVDGVPTEIRRPARGRAQNVSLSIRFPSGRMPAQVWWSVWPDHLDGGPVRETPVPLRYNGYVRQVLPFIEQTVVGFRWEWPTPQ